MNYKEHSRFGHNINIQLSVQSQFVVIFTLKSSIYDLSNIKGLLNFRRTFSEPGRDSPLFHNEISETLLSHS